MNDNQMPLFFGGLCLLGIIVLFTMIDIDRRATERRKAVQQEQGPRRPFCKHPDLKEGDIVRILPSEKKGVVIWDPSMRWGHGHLVSYVDNEGQVREAHLQDTQIAIVSSAQ